MTYSNEELHAKLQLLLEKGHVDEYFVEDVRDYMLFSQAMSVPEEPTPELFEGINESLDKINIRKKHH